MYTDLFWPILAGLALTFSVLAFARRLRVFNALPRPADRSPAKGNARAGVLYAFTWGMLPWAKESTRRHFIAYTRGVGFHLGIFLGLGILIASLWLTPIGGGWRVALAIATGIGALLGLVGFVARLVEHNLRALSTRDDYFAVFIVSLFLTTASLWLLDPTTAPAFYGISAIMFVYAPLGKIRHCIYYAYSRLFFGKFVGRRAVLPPSQQAKVTR
jgi:nitrate reductase gamma subunit